MAKTALITGITDQDGYYSTRRLCDWYRSADSVRKLVAAGFECLGLDWTRHVVVEPRFLRLDEHFQLVANPTQPKIHLNEEPQVSFETLFAKMVLKHLERLQSGSITP